MSDLSASPADDKSYRDSRVVYVSVLLTGYELQRRDGGQGPEGSFWQDTRGCRLWDAERLLGRPFFCTRRARACGTARDAGENKGKTERGHESRNMFRYGPV